MTAEDENDMPQNGTDSNVLSLLRQEIQSQVDDGLESVDMQRLVALSPWSRRQMERRFRDHFLTSPARYFRDYQAECAESLLTAGHDVLSVSVRSGFASPGRLHDAITTRYGLTPGELRRKGKGVRIQYGFFETQLGIVLIAATKRGICSLMICGAAPSRENILARLDELEAEFPNADIEESTEPLQEYADMLVAFLDARVTTFNPPIDILQGTTFQREVWAELRKLEPGETVSYTELAERIGRPKAVRAVANACKDNRCAIAIPCHRVIRSDGTLAGYRWGLDWKQRLLQIEAQMRPEAVMSSDRQN